LTTTWRKSSRSGSSGQSDCVEVAYLGGNIGLRDSKEPEGPHLVLSSAGWGVFARRVKCGDHDLH
jgi:hypothetical protein